MTRVYWRTPEADGPPVTGQVQDGPPPARVDVAIIGAGFAGLSIACDLLNAAPGIRLAVLDAHRAGYGASGRNAGVLPFVPLWLLPGGAGRFDHAAVHRLLYARIARRPGGFAESAGPEHSAGPERLVEPAAPTRMALLGRSRLLMAGLDWMGESLVTAGFRCAAGPGARRRSTGFAPRARSSWTCGSSSRHGPWPRSYGSRSDPVGGCTSTRRSTR